MWSAAKLPFVWPGDPWWQSGVPWGSTSAAAGGREQRQPCSWLLWGGESCLGCHPWDPGAPPGCGAAVVRQETQTAPKIGTATLPGGCEAGVWRPLLSCVWRHLFVYWNRLQEDGKQLRKDVRIILYILPLLILAWCSPKGAWLAADTWRSFPPEESRHWPQPCQGTDVPEKPRTLWKCCSGNSY